MSYEFLTSSLGEQENFEADSCFSFKVTKVCHNWWICIDNGSPRMEPKSFCYFYQFDNLNHFVIFPVWSCLLRQLFLVLLTFFCSRSPVCIIAYMQCFWVSHVCSLEAEHVFSLSLADVTEILIWYQICILSWCSFLISLMLKKQKKRCWWCC